MEKGKCRICGEAVDRFGITCAKKECKRTNDILRNRDYRRAQLEGAPRIYPVKKINLEKSPRTVTMKNGVEVLNNIVYKAIRANDCWYNPARAVITIRMRFNGKKTKQHHSE